MDLRDWSWSDVNNNLLYGEERNPNGMASEESAHSWARFIIGPTVRCPALVGERQIWVEYDPRNTIQELLSTLKDSLGISADVALYVQGFYVQPQLKASFLLKVQHPVVLLPCGQTRFPFEREVEASRHPAITVVTPPPTEQTPLCVSGRSGRIITGADNDSEVTQPVQSSPMEDSVEESVVLSLPLIPDTKTSSPGVQIFELNPTSSPDKPTTPSTGKGRGRPRSRKLKNDLGSPANDGKAPLESSSAENENIPIRRSTRRTSNTLFEAGCINKKRASSVHDENIPPQKAKRLKSTAGKETDDLAVDVSGGSPIMKKPPGRKAMKSTKIVSLVPSLITAKLEELLGNDYIDEALGTDSTTRDNNGFEIKLSASVSEKESTLEASEAQEDKFAIETIAYSNVPDTSEAANMQGTSLVKDSPSLKKLDVPTDSQTPAMPYTSDDILITSADQIVPGSIIQAEMLVGYGDGNQLMVTHVMKVVAVDGETFSAVPPTAIIEGGIDISQIFTMSFENLIRPKLLNEVHFETLVNVHGLVEVDSFDENML